MLINDTAMNKTILVSIFIGQKIYKTNLQRWESDKSTRNIVLHILLHIIV